MSGGLRPIGAAGPTGATGAAGPAPSGSANDAVYLVSSGVAGARSEAAQLAVGAAANRDALSAYVSLGATYNTGFTSGQYLDVPGTPAAAPEFGTGQSLVVLIYPTGTPSGAEVIAAHADTTSVRGWHLRSGDTAGDRSELSLYMHGLNATAIVRLTPATWSGATLTPHVLAVAITAGKVVRYSWDGGTVTATAALSGTYDPPTSGDPFRIGCVTDGPPGTAVSVSCQVVQLRAYSTVLSDADLVAVAATRTAYQLATPSAGTLTADIHVRQLAAVGCIASATVLDRANTARRWRVVGSPLLHERT